MSRPFLWIISGVVGLGLIVLLAMSIVTEEQRDSSAGFGEVEVNGDPLPVLGDQGDVATGFPAATVRGADWNGVESSIEADGRPKVIIFLAHWCPHCQAEVPVVQGWIDAGNLPDDVDIYAVTTSTDPSRTNWPPQDWLEEEGWTVPTIMDDSTSTVAIHYGMAGTPFYAVLDGENTNLIRVSGQIGIPGLEALVGIAQESVTS